MNKVAIVSRCGFINRVGFSGLGSKKNEATLGIKLGNLHRGMIPLLSIFKNSRGPCDRGRQPSDTRNVRSTECTSKVSGSI